MPQISFIIELISYVIPYLLVAAVVVFLALVCANFFVANTSLLNYSVIILGAFIILAAFNVIQHTGLPKIGEFTKTIQANSNQAHYKIGFFNKLYSNQNYQNIDQTLNELDLNIIGFSEFKKEDAAHILKLKDYAYHLSKDARDDSTIALYSKHPISLDEMIDIPFVLPVIMEINQKEYRVFVIHPEPPINITWLQSRNENLLKLANYINTLEDQDRVIIMGDFNTPPFSPTYQKISKKLTGHKNAAQGTGLSFSWHGQFIKTQIDHILVPNAYKVNSFNSVEVAGSDHSLIWVDISMPVDQ